MKQLGVQFEAVQVTKPIVVVLVPVRLDQELGLGPGFPEIDVDRERSE